MHLQMSAIPLEKNKNWGGKQVKLLEFQLRDSMDVKVDILT